MGEMRMPARPAISELITQFATAIRFGDRPVTTAPFSVSAAARVASPNRVNRRPKASAAAITMIVAPR
jgi:hypothetical protein